MMEQYITVALGLTLLFIYFRKKIYSISSGKLPPGPRGLPLIGNLHQFGTTMHKSFHEWSKQYGKIYTVRFGLQDTVVINDPAMVKELFSTDAASGRPDNKMFKLMSDGDYGMGNTEGHQWETLRKFTVRHLRDFGFGKNAMEDLIISEVTEVLQWMKSSEGQPIDLDHKLTVAALNSLWTIFNGKRFTDDHCVKNLMDFMAALDTSISSGLAFAPSIRFFAPEKSGWNAFSKACAQMNQYLQANLEERLKNFQPEMLRDFYDHFIAEIKTTKDPESQFYEERGFKNMHSVTTELFIAGSTPTAATIQWIILYLLDNPLIALKLQEEIDNVIPQTRLPSLSDRPNMPYTDAVIKESLRHSSHFPIGVIHSMRDDIEFHGYTLPKGTWIISNLYSIHHDEKIWGDPDVFRPERFISNTTPTSSEMGTRNPLLDSLMPFSIGKRHCVGDSLGKDSVFLFITSIYQKFNLQLNVHNDGNVDGKPNLEPDVNFFLHPKRFSVIVQERK